ncbi:phosphate ABC transporter permease subunit PstC [Conexibacter sp. W3-3-2]|uniref:phosphate ABC transporter permease subunit PstC n=1 Tax=Conexibacter sp. W3-3-2 TaxID=2675227 RepID=UPI0012B905D7|nr:phosphate ABC transporter permease subunit PstC [Conexibacter sp. W3-3-2]MTD44012.1 phosphate ABC transporter permease subunit PstC [Conexibacter sp. W3-3-2]
MASGPEVVGRPGATSISLVRQRTPRSVGEQGIKLLLAGAAGLSILITVLILAALVRETISFFGEVPVGDYLFGTDWNPLAGGESQSFGVLPLLWSTLYLTGIALTVAIPLGLGVAVYLAEYASPRIRKVFKPVIELLAGIPTVVFGFFALQYFTKTFLQGWLGLDVNIFNGLSAGIVLGFLVLPTIASVSEDALSAVPASLREGAAGLGASKRQTTMKVVFPAALSGVVAGLVLGASRAIGETVIILLAAGNAPNLSLDLTISHQNMAAFIANTARSDVAAGSIGYSTLFAVGMTLFVICFTLNLLAIRFVRKYRQVYE